MKKEEIINDWESEFEIDKEKFLFFDKSSGSRWLHEKKIKDFIKSVVSSTEKRVAQTILKEIKESPKTFGLLDKQGNGSAILVMDIEEIIKSKYEK